MARIEWIAVDWGTSALRLWGIGPSGEILAQTSAPRGMGRLEPAGYLAALEEATRDWPLPEAPVETVVCGMAGAREGWLEAPYLRLPARPDGRGAVHPEGGGRFRVSILPGLAQIDPTPDVMRGEETQIAGLLALGEIGDSGLVCLPGTHSKWALLEGGRVIRFATLMTGEIFALLSGQSVLRHNLSGEDSDPEAFDEGLRLALAAPERLSAEIFPLRAAALLEDRRAPWGRGRLSGLLIGAELAATRDWRRGGEVVLVGAPALSALYARALALEGAASRSIDAGQAVLAGLAAARRALNASD